MTVYDYKVVPAPTKGRKARGMRGSDQKFAYAIETVMNEMAQDGWEFQRTETLPCHERSGLSSQQASFRNVMVFRKPRPNDLSAFHPRQLERPSLARIATPHHASNPTQPKHTPPPQITPDKAPPLTLGPESRAEDDFFVEPEGQNIGEHLPIALRRRAAALDADGPDIAAE